MKSLRFIIAGFISTLLLTASVPAFAQSSYFAATSKGESCQALQDISPQGGGCQNPDGTSVNKLIKIAINLISLVAGIIAVIMLIVSGFKYITSQGDANQTASAKNSLIYAIVGLVVVALAQFIVQFVLARTLSS